MLPRLIKKIDYHISDVYIVPYTVENLLTLLGGKDVKHVSVRFKISARNCTWRVAYGFMRPFSKSNIPI